MNRNRHRPFLIFALASASMGSLAETPPPAAPFDAITWKAAMKRKPSTGLQMGAFRAQLERTTLDYVRRAASVGEIAHRGDAGESTYWLCYTNSGETQTERIWIVADGEMGGSEHYITNISAERLPDGTPTADCPALPNNLKPLSLDNGLWLGASEGATRAKLGAPSHRKESWRSYDFQGKVPGKCEGGSIELFSWLLLHIQGRSVNSLQIGQVTSC